MSETDTPVISRTHPVLRRLTLVAATALFLFSLPAFLPSLMPWAPDLVSHFALQYALAAFLVMFWAVWFFRSDRVIRILLAVAIGVNIAVLLPYTPGPSSELTYKGESLKVMQANVLFLNKDTHPFETLAAAEKPDIIVVEEVNTPFAALFEKMKKDYPYQKVASNDHGADGLATLSKLPFKLMKVTTFNGAGMPAHIFEVQSQRQEIFFVSLHTVNPLHDVPARDAAFEGAKDAVIQRKDPNTVILGDFNATPWCPAMHSLMDGLPDLRNARAGRGLYLSWPAFLPQLLRIPIDQTLVGKSLVILDYHLGPGIGSDHFPIITTMALRRHS